MSHPRHIVGVMSGTSLDGIDVAVTRLDGNEDELSVELLAFDSRPFPEVMAERLHRASIGEMSLREVCELEVDLGHCYADAIAQVLANASSAVRIDAVGLHGQTVFHNPRRTPNGVTVQLHGAPIVAERLRTPVISDFRSADVAAGGEGAPLVPYCDYLLLRSPLSSRVALNIGGIANITWLPRTCAIESLIAFDTGPGNMMIDAAMSHLFGRPFDSNGDIAASATPDAPLLDELMKHEYLHRPFPKSTGREVFGKERTIALVNDAIARRLSPQTIVSTLTALTARSIVLGIRQAAGARTVEQVIVSGGGARNRRLMEFLQLDLPEATIIPSGALGLPGDAKEAICFAILADAHLRGIPANVPSVTGARRRVVLGARWQP